MEKKHQNHQSKKPFSAFLATFERVHNAPRPNQFVVLEAMSQSNELIVQASTGTGKTALGYSFLQTHCGPTGNGMYVCPNKALVDAVVTQYRDIAPMYGRNEYPCLYYQSAQKADEVPCSLLRECPHRVDLKTGETAESGAKPCPYLQAKFESRKSKLVACTTAYYFYEALGRENLPDALVVDEAHEWADSIRGMLEYKISDYSLEQFWVLLTAIDCRTEAKHIRDFCDAMIAVLKQYESGRRTSIIVDDDLRSLLKIILRIKRSNIDDKIKSAIRQKKINPVEDRELLKQLDDFTGALYRYVKSFEFALATTDRKPLSYVFGSWDKELVPGKKAQYVLTVRSYMISGLTRARLIPEVRMAMSATIGDDPSVFIGESGIEGDFINLDSDFPIENTKVFMPTDMPDLSLKAIRHGDKNKTLRRILRAVKTGTSHGVRSLVIVVSDEERRKLIAFAEEEKVLAVSYGEGISSREAVRMFKEGYGDVLIGTEAQYGKGIDLPNGTAGFIFYMRPGYPSPEDPQAQFEELRLGNRRWALWTWRVIIKMLQARGRNIRSATDTGCIFLMSQQFKRFTYAGLPKWLKPAYVYEKSFDQCVQDGLKLLQK